MKLDEVVAHMCAATSVTKFDQIVLKINKKFY